MKRKDYWIVVTLTLTASLVGGAISAQLYLGKHTQKMINATEIHFSDNEGQIRAKFVLGIHGEPGLALYDKDGQPRITLGLGSKGEPSLNLLDNNSKIIWSAP